MKTAVCTALLLLCACTPLFSQTSQTKPKTRLVFNCQCTDPVGQLVASAFRDLLATSPRYVEANQAEEKDTNGKTTTYNWKLVVVSEDPTNDNSGQSTAMSAVLLLGDSYYMTQSVQSCGMSRASFCAQQMLSVVDNFLNTK